MMKNNAGNDPSNNPNHAKRDSFATKVAVVTGASRGIGLALAKRLIANGYRVVANSRNIGSAMTLQNTADLKLVDGDIALQETAKLVVAIAVQNFGRIDLLVNNAGVFIPKSFRHVASIGQLAFDTVEVCGSSPHGPTIIFNTLESFLRNPAKTSPVILHL